MKKIFFTLLTLTFVVGAAAQDSNRVDNRGRKQGLWKKYDKNILLYEGNFVNDVPTGVFTYYHKNGKIKSECDFISGTSKVKATLYHENGQKSGEGIFVDQIKDSVWNYYGQDGKLIKVESYRNGEKHGEWKTFSAQTGILLEEERFDNGRLNGPAKIFFINGDLQNLINYIDGQRNGAFESYYTGNVLSSKGVYHNNLPIDTWTYYDGDGQLRKTVDYKDGKVQATYLHLYNGGSSQKVNQNIIAYFRKVGEQTHVVMNNGATFVSTDDFTYLKTLVDLDEFCPVTPNLLAANSAIKGYAKVDDDRILVRLAPSPDFEVYSEGNEMHFVMMLFDTTPMKEE